MPTHLQYAQLILQALSAFSIAAGLIFAAYQFWHLRRAQLVGNFSKLVELQMHLRELRVHDPELAHTFSHDVEELHSPKEIREYFMNLMQLSVFEIVWYAHEQGQVPEDYFQSWVTRMRDIQSEDSFRKMMKIRAMKIMHDDFQSYVARMMAESGAAPR